jgi:hypothetical protein
MSRLIALWLIDTAVMINLGFIGFILCVFGFVLYPIKPARQFCGNNDKTPPQTHKNTPC